MPTSTLTPAFAEQVAAELEMVATRDGTWSADGWALQSVDTGEGVLLRPAWGEPRLVISGLFPATDFTFRGGRPDITVAATRTPQDIAREIRRRLLPSYRPMLATVRAYNADREAEAAARRDVATRIAAQLPGSAISADYRRERTVAWDGGSSGPYRGGIAYVHSDATTVRIEARVSADLAVRIAELIAAADRTAT